MLEVIEKLVKFFPEPISEIVLSVSVVWAFFGMLGQLIDVNISADAKRYFGLFLTQEISFDGRPEYVKEIKRLFQDLFGEKHLSIRCFATSAVFTTSSIFVVLVVIFLRWHIDPFGKDQEKYWHSIISIWLPIAIAIDYVSLFKERLILNYFVSRPHAPAYALVLTIVADFLASVFLFLVSVVLANLIATAIAGGQFNASTAHTLVSRVSYTFLVLGKAIEMQFDRRDWQFWVLFASGLVPLLWIWAAAAATVLVRVLANFKPVLKFMQWCLPFKTNPMRSTGIFAGLMVNCGYVVLEAAYSVSRL